MENALKAILDKAADQGLIEARQAAPLAVHLAAHGVGVPSMAGEIGAKSAGGFLAELTQPKDDAPFGPSEESEAPRFVRGFHDVLITVGVVVALTGLAMLGTVFALIPAVIVLAEILVRRQRLALPAFALTIAYVMSVSWIVITLFGGDSSLGTVGQMVAIYAGCAAALAPFYWRYRVPVSLAALVLAGIGLAYFIVMQLSGAGTLEETVTSGFSLVTAFVFSLAAFAAAMWFDIRDRMRVTRRSDVAFWLHLGTAPALLNSALGVALWQTSPGSFWMQSLTGGQAAVALAVLIAFMLIGLIIDRRAFVTAGILSLGYALSALIKNAVTGFDTSYLFAWSALAVGITVLLLGVGWLPLRARLLTVLPAAIRERVPPAAA